MRPIFASGSNLLIRNNMQKGFLKVYLTTFFSLVLILKSLQPHLGQRIFLALILGESALTLRLHFLHIHVLWNNLASASGIFPILNSLFHLF